jgi:hypothetical protein
MGAEGGVSYKDDKWPAELTKMLPKDRPYLEYVELLRPGDVDSPQCGCRLGRRTYCDPSRPPTQDWRHHLLLWQHHG